VDGDRIYAIISKGPGRNRIQAMLEAHRKYIDIQYVISGIDEMGWKSLADCGLTSREYDKDKDVVFFKDAPVEWVKVRAGSFAVFFPQDAHAPLVGDGEIHKAVVKVAVE
jgi:YhcH/YjgK/YiaL family protein